MHTNALDEAIALPTDFSARIARNTQIYLQKEIGITSYIDPYHNSFFIEKLTQDLIQKANKLINEVEDLGGMSKAIETGIPKLRIEEAAARKQARIDSGKDNIIGLNLFKSDEDIHLDTLDVDNNKVRDSQLLKLKNIKANRDDRQVVELLNELERCAKTGNGNLLEISIRCAEARCTLGEISSALEKVYNRYTAKIKSISGVYSNEAKMDKDFIESKKLIESFSALEGRRPRIMIAKMGQDGHDRGAKIISSSFADIGFDVDIGPLFQTPNEVATQAIENDVHVLGVSSLAAGHKTLVPAVIDELRQMNRSDIMVVVGGVIPQKDYKYLYDVGVFGIYGPGTKISLAAQEILKLLIQSHK